MKLYWTRIPLIAKAVIDTLCNKGAIEVALEARAEAELDLVSIMEEYLRRDQQLRNTVRERMANENIAYQNYGRLRNRMAEEWNHPVGDSVEKYLARQVIENFMISRFVDEVYEEDNRLWKSTLEILQSFDVDEDSLRAEARAQLKNIAEGTVDYEIALSQSLRDVKKRKGLI